MMGFGHGNERGHFAEDEYLAKYLFFQWGWKEP